MAELSTDEGAAAMKGFCEFLRFETVSSIARESGAYKACGEWLINHCREVLPCLDEVFLLNEAPEDSPVVVAVWKGINPTLPILLLNSHYDVVPVDTSMWTVPAFDGLRRDGKIYGRGTQDMKCVCIQYIHALAKIRALDPEWMPARSIYLTFVPDEEVGGAGMAAFLDSALYKSLPGIALALDEGLASTDNAFSVFYGERLPWWVEVQAKGPTGHGSRFIENTAVEQLVALANKALEFRQGQRSLLGLTDHTNCAHAVAKKKAQEPPQEQAVVATTSGHTSTQKTLGDVTSLNITTLQAGVAVGDTFAYNCVPPVAKCSLDIRISPHTDPSEIGAMLDEWCQECSATQEEHKLSWSYIGHTNSSKKHATTSTDPVQNPWFKLFLDTLDSIGIPLKPEVFPAATDSRFLRALGIRALGFSPMRNTEIMLHENDEYIPETVFLEGIGVYVTLLRALASAEHDM